MYRENGRKFKGLKIIHLPSNDFKTTNDMMEQINQKKKNGDFAVLPENDLESEIKIDKKKYKIKYSNEKLYLSEFNSTNSKNYILYDIQKESSNNIKVYDPFYDFTYYFDIKRLNYYQGSNDQKDKLKYIGVFEEYVLFFYHSESENDGLFLVTKEFNINLYKSKILSSFNKETKKVWIL